MKDMYDSLFASSDMLNEQIAGEIFDFVPEQGLFIIIRDSDGRCWSSDEAGFAEYFPDAGILKRTCDKIDDGYDPVIDQADGYSFVAAQLSTEQVNCGYVFLVLPGYTSETTLANIGIIELFLAQTALVARLIDKNNRLHCLQLQQLSSSSSNHSPVPR